MQSRKTRTAMEAAQPINAFGVIDMEKIQAESKKQHKREEDELYHQYEDAEMNKAIKASLATNQENEEFDQAEINKGIAASKAMAEKEKELAELRKKQEEVLLASMQLAIVVNDADEEENEQRNKRRRVSDGKEEEDNPPDDDDDDDDIREERSEAAEYDPLIEFVMERSKKEIYSEVERDRGEPLTTEQFAELLHNVALRGDLNNSLHDIEKGPLVTSANSNYRESTTQRNFQYGRMTIFGTEQILNLANLQSSEIFLDIGSGIGTVALQAASCIGCEARGIEYVRDRVFISKQIRLALDTAINELGPFIKTGRTEFLEGDFTHAENRERLAEANVAFVNNSEGIYSQRAGMKNSQFPDSSVAAIFAQMKPGSRLISLCPLYDLGLDCEESNRDTFSYNPDASFFRYEQVSIEAPSEDSYHEGHKGVVSWHTTAKNLSAHKYTRITQKSFGGGTAVFSCQNCKGVSRALTDKGTLRTTCSYCLKTRSRQSRSAATAARQNISEIFHTLDA
uniref:Histone-lysine N-methyltransferase, H3 lysine-79 specific n=1 Tax=Aureoumbra lagunensis TaxID=44058 RepID=A0A7S3JV74_9STRA